MVGHLVTKLRHRVAFTINAASYSLSALALRGLRVTGPVEHVHSRELLAEACEGFTVLLHQRLPRALATGRVLAALPALIHR